MFGISHSRAAGLCLAALATLALVATDPALAAKKKRGSAKQMTFIDVHLHLSGRGRRTDDDFAGAAGSALAAMDELGIVKGVLMPYPFGPNQDGTFTFAELRPIARQHPDRFAFLGGGGTLNVMIHEAARKGATSAAMRRRFANTAERIVAAGAIGFGELVAEHVSKRPGHPYISAPPDHPLFLLLADIAARHDLPIDLHMEAVPDDMPLPKGLSSPPNPKRLRANIAAFERLLTHNRRAKIVWAHVGWDNTGFRNAGLTRRLLGRHPNLYLSTKITHSRLFAASEPIDEDGEIKPEWLEAIGAFPDRFLIGTDLKFAPPGKSRKGKPRTGIHKILRTLPRELARRVAVDNARRVFRLGE